MYICIYHPAKQEFHQEADSSIRHISGVWIMCPKKVYYGFLMAVIPLNTCREQVRFFSHLYMLRWSPCHVTIRCTYCDDITPFSPSFDPYPCSSGVPNPLPMSPTPTRHSYRLHQMPSTTP